MPVPHTILLMAGIPVSHAFLRLVSMHWPHDVLWPMPTSVLCASLCSILAHVLLAISQIAGHCSHAVVALVVPVPFGLRERCRPLICQNPLSLTPHTGGQPFTFLLWLLSPSHLRVSEGLSTASGGSSADSAVFIWWWPL